MRRRPPPAGQRQRARCAARPSAPFSLHNFPPSHYSTACRHTDQAWDRRFINGFSSGELPDEKEIMASPDWQKYPQRFGSRTEHWQLI